MPLGVAWGQIVGLTDFCCILTLLPPGASVFHKHMSCSQNILFTVKLLMFTGKIMGEAVGQVAILARSNFTLFNEAVKKCCFSDSDDKVAFVGVRLDYFCIQSYFRATKFIPHILQIKYMYQNRSIHLQNCCHVKLYHFVWMSVYLYVWVFMCVCVPHLVVDTLYLQSLPHLTCVFLEHSSHNYWFLVLKIILIS